MRFKTNMKRFILAAACVLALFFSQPGNGLALSIPEEKELAKEFMAMIQKQQLVMKDPVVNHYINQMGRHLLAYVPPQPFKFSFYVVDEDVFNAFAGPGANIFFYRGLITSLNSADELAGIFGHEIAHSVSRHVAQSIERAKYLSIGSLAGMLAGVVIGRSSDPQAAQAIITGTAALGHTSMLAFTRENETEADEQGIMFLKQSCFSPTGLLNGLMRIREADYRGVEGIPDYVKTHPGTGTRIAHAETILEGYIEPDTKPACVLDFDFDMIKYRLIGLYGDPDTVFNDLNTRLSRSEGDAALHYAMGLVYARQQRRQEALVHLKQALALRMLDPIILTDLGRVYLLNGEPEKALNALQGIESEPGTGILARLYQADANLALNYPAKSEQGYRAVINKAPTAFPEAYFNLARIKSMSGNTGLSHYYLGIYYTLAGNSKNAVRHLNKAVDTLSDPNKKEDAKKRLATLKKQSK